ncbi:MAG: SDR family NAD(P)-dependent oxidoreductase, partial [Acidobacteria bacterium]|nr:SDR family NAD(P)-dependent oxidoreductase [Acidobacteriota bacterium]
PRLVDLDPEGAPAAGALADELLHPDPETRVARRGADRLVARLRRAARTEPADGAGSSRFPGRLRPDRSYLVTGGLGGIGLEVAGWLVERGAGTVVLNGRRPPGAAAEAVVSELRGRGAEVRVEIADVTDEAATAEMLDRVEAELPPLGGVIHAAGVLSDGVLVNQDWGRFETVLWPKVLGAWRLHRAMRDRDLDLFVLFSSVAGVLGNAGQANHAAANAFLDQLARHRRALGLPGQAIAWGAWSGVGEAEEQRERIAGRLARSGEDWMTPEQGIEALARLLREDVGTRVVASVDWLSFPLCPPWLEELVARKELAPMAVREDLPRRLRGLGSAEREEELIRFLQGELASVLRLRTAPSPDVGFFELGMDSLMAVELRSRLNREFQGALVLSNTAVFDHPNALRLARRLAREFETAPPQREVRTPVAGRWPPAERVAIVGMACRFPGGADPEAFWEQLAGGRDAVTRGRPDGLFVDRETETARPLGAYVEGLDRFDAEFFRIAPVEAELLDPQQRLLLEVSWEALEDAGVDPGGLRGSRTGVYAGMMNNDYRDLLEGLAEDPSRSLYRTSGVTFSTAVGRVAFALGLEGPAIAVDTACSASLVAVHQAVSALRQGEADLALAGGVNAILRARTTRRFADAGMLSPDGRCKTFDAAADGFVRGEGCGMLALKRLSDAEASGDRILGVLLGSAVNQDGASAGLTVPNGPAQERLIREALERAGVAPAEVDYLEAHGTGTELGDPVELAAAAAVYGRGRDPARPLLVGSVKTNVGHLEGAAGVAGLIKTVSAMRRGVIPPHLHLETPNPRIPWVELPVRVAGQATPWPDAADRPRRAGVSSFGYSGTNAHVVVEGYADPSPAVVVGAPASGRQRPPAAGETHAAERGNRVLPLSARSGKALAELAGRYREWLAEDTPLADAAWTAGTGRSHFEHRAGLVFRDLRSLREGLRRASETGGAVVPEERPRVAFLYTGQGSQWRGMGRELYGGEPVFREVLDRCEGVVREERGVSLLS